MSDPAHSTLDGPLIGALNDGMEMLQSTVHVGEGKLFHSSPLLDDVNKVRRGLCYLIYTHQRKKLTVLDRYST